MVITAHCSIPGDGRGDLYRLAHDQLLQDVTVAVLLLQTPRVVAEFGDATAGSRRGGLFLQIGLRSRRRLTWAILGPQCCKLLLLCRGEKPVHLVVRGVTRIPEFCHFLLLGEGVVAPDRLHLGLERFHDGLDSRLLIRREVEGRGQLLKQVSGAAFPMRCFGSSLALRALGTGA